MKIINNYDLRGWFDVRRKVFWRVFGAWDDSHVFGLSDGLLDFRGSADYNDSDFFQLEFKADNFMGDILASAGQIYPRWYGDIALGSDGHTVTQDFPAWNLPKGQYTAWMDNAKVQNKTLHDIAIACTHDSGAWRLAPRLFSDSKASDVPESLAAAFAVAKSAARGLADTVESLLRPICTAQSRPIDQQLNEGIRGIDLRAVTINGRLYTGHGMVGEPLQYVLQKVKQFLEQTTRELVVLMLGVGSTTSAGDGKARLKGLVEGTFGDRLVPADVDLKTTKIGDLTQGKSRVLVTTSDPIPGIRNEADLGYKGDSYWWVNTDDPATLESKVVEKVKGRQAPDDWSNPGWTLTAQMARLTDPAAEIGLKILKYAAMGVIGIPFVIVELEKLIALLQTVQDMSILTMSRKVNPRLRSVVEGPLANDRINQLSVDFYEESPVVELAVVRSMR